MTQVTDPLAAFDADVLYQCEHDVKVEAVENLAVLALSIGPERSLNLLKDLTRYYVNEPEELLVALSCRLGDLLKVSSPNSVSDEAMEAFLRAVEGLSESCSHHVNSALTYSFNRILCFTQTEIHAICVFVQKLASTTNTMQRSLSASLIPMLYDAVDRQEAEKLQLKQLLGQIFGELVQDTDALVRQTCAGSVENLIKNLEVSKETDKFVRSPTYIFACFDRLAQDLADLVRSSNVENGLYILELICYIKESTPDQESREYKEVKEILPQLIKAISRGSSDRYWRIRYKTALLMPDFFKQVHQKLDVSDCAVMYKLLTEDCEPDIREVALLESGRIIDYLDLQTIVNVFAPALLARCEQKETLRVKTALLRAGADVFAKLSTLQDDVKAQLKATVTEIVQKLVADQDQEIRAACIEFLPSFAPVLEEFVFDTMRDVIGKKDTKWRVRVALLQAALRIVVQQNRGEELVELQISLLQDDVFEVRKACIEMIDETGVKKGILWLTKGVMTSVRNVLRAATGNFETRISCSQCLMRMLKVYLKSPVNDGLEVLTQQILTLQKDSNIYVRKELCIGVRAILEYFVDAELETMKQEVKDLLKGMLAVLVKDDSKDVRDEATDVLEMLEGFE